MRLVQFTDRSGARRVAASDDGKTLRVLAGVPRVFDLALAAARANSSLESAAKAKIGAETVSYDDVVDEKRLLPPLDHPDLYRCLITGTGLSHLGSAAARDSRHAKFQKDESELTDSAPIFALAADSSEELARAAASARS